MKIARVGYGAIGRSAYSVIIDAAYAGGVYLRNVESA